MMTAALGGCYAMAYDQHASITVHETVPMLTADEVLQDLLAGNKRFVAGKPLRPHTSMARIRETSNGQHPVAVCLSCADSRVPPEVLFDRGIGDIFTVRVAGNVSNNDEIASLEYAVEHFGSPLCIVLGHTECDAVKTVVDGDKVAPSIGKMVKHVIEAVDKTRKYNAGLKGPELLYESVRVNVWESVEDMLKDSEIISARVRTGQLKVVGGVYHIDDGKVELLGVYPRALSILR